ncbi:hypothetical protein [Paenibacillus barengoltzii]|uniref:hypothetical protein n=1 Tax=Paenibacillus barengoltzii TaxID=343517 RepID=UPI0038795D50
MKITVFYSWQSDLPNNKNRGFISDALESAIKKVYKSRKVISEIKIESDSRNEVGTPDLVESIFKKIDSCDVFVADISIINSNAEERKVPNPNVLLELGYAAKSLGWSKVICLYNSEFAPVEALPFDIRSRKPIVYNTSENSTSEKQRVSAILGTQLTEIIDYCVDDKKLYSKQKQKIDLAMQAILIDICTLIFRKGSNFDKFNYPRLLNMNAEELKEQIYSNVLIGFDLFRNIMESIDDFSEFINDEVETFFLNIKEKRLLIKLIYSLKNYQDFLNRLETHSKDTLGDEYVTQIHSSDPEKNLVKVLLLKKIDSQKAVVISGGSFKKADINKLQRIYKLSERETAIFVNLIIDITSTVNEWINTTGDYFIINERLFP